MSAYPTSTVVSRVLVTFPALTLGTVDAYGVEWYVEKLDGWDSPATAGDSQQRFRSSGAWAAPWTYAPRQINIGGVAVCDSATVREGAEDRLFGAVTLTDQVVSVKRDLAARQSSMRQNGGVTKTLLNECVFRFSLSLIALDPFRYSTVEHLLQTKLPSYTGGIQLPVTMPFTIGSVADTGLVIAGNVGTAESWPRWRVDGPVLHPRVTLDGDVNRSFWFDYDLKSGQRIEMDSRTGDVILNGTELRAGILRGDPEALYPGSTEVSFSGDSYSAAALLRLWWRDAWK